MNIVINNLVETGLVEITRPAAGRRPKLFVYRGQISMILNRKAEQTFEGQEEQTKEATEAASRLQVLGVA
ncbi:MAG: hypothetical protein ACR2JE_12830 [Acidobacteriaceae bacterium]